MSTTKAMLLSTPVSRRTCTHMCTEMSMLQQATKVKLSLAGSVSDYTSSVQDKIKSEMAASAGCAASQITLTVAAGSVVVTASMPSTSASKLIANVKSGQLKTLGGHTVAAAALAPRHAATDASGLGRPAKVMVYIVMAYIFMACTVMANMVMACIFMACIVMT